MAASKENHSCSSSAAHPHRNPCSLRSPLSPIHHNSSSSRLPEHSTPSSRRPIRDPTRPLLPPHGVRSPPLLSSHGARCPPLPRSPNPNSVGRKLLKDGAVSDPVSRFKPQKDRNTSLPRNKGLIQVSNPAQTKRQTQLFLQQTSHDPYAVEKAGAFNHKWLENTESEKNQKPCRRKWRRFPRESVLRSLRGESLGDFLGLAAAGMGGLDRNANPSSIGPNPSPKEAELLLEGGLMAENLYHDLSFAVFAGAKFPAAMADNHLLVSNSQAPDANTSEVGLRDEEAKQETLVPPVSKASSLDSPAENPLTVILPADKTSTTTLSVDKTLTLAPPTDSALTLTPPADSFLILTPSADSALTLTPTPPADKSPTLTSPADKNLTPPMQPTQSPDFIKREGMRGLLPIDGKCYAAPCGLVKDRRKCKPRGVLTVDAGHEILSSAESELGLGSCQPAQQMPTPAGASVEWMLDERRNLGGDSSPDFASTSTDLCRMSFPRLSPSHFDELSEDETELKSCQGDGDALKRSLLQASVSVSGYEWGASSSQGMHSSCRTEASSANPRRSIVFDDEAVDKNRMKTECFPTRFGSNIMHNIVFEEGADKSDPSSAFSEEESGECLPMQNLVPSEGSPPFEYSLLRSLKAIDSSKVDHSSWSKCLPDEVMLSISGPMDSSLSSQDHEFDAKSEVRSITAAAGKCDGRLVCFQGGKALPNVDCRTFDITAAELHQPSNDISSRIAMAKFLCNITATYLDDIATCLGKGRADVDARRTPENDINESLYDHLEGLDNFSLEQSSLLVGRRKMAECCSLLRGLTLETSKSKVTSSMSSECSVNQPSPSLKEDTADSSLAHFYARHLLVPSDDRTWCNFPSSLARSSPELVSSPFSSMEDDPFKKSTAMPTEPAMKAMQGAMSLGSLKEMAWLPSRGMIAVAYFITGLVAISHTYHKRVKQARKCT